MLALTVQAPRGLGDTRRPQAHREPQLDAPAEFLGQRIAIDASRNARHDEDARQLLAAAGVEMPPVDLLDEVRGRVCGSVKLVDVAPYARERFAEDKLATGPLLDRRRAPMARPHLPSHRLARSVGVAARRDANRAAERRPNAMAFYHADLAKRLRSMKPTQF